MSSELELLKQRITELEAENSANGEYNKRRDAENAKLKARIEELESEFRDRIMKVEQKQTLNDYSSNLSSSNFNLVADQVPMVTHHEKSSVDTSLPEDKETDAFLDEVHKKKVSNEIRQRNREKKLQAQESLPISPEEKRPQVLDSITYQLIQSARRGRTLCPGKFTSDNKSSIDEALQHLAQLCDRAFDAEDKANRANQEEILCRGDKFGKKKAKGLLYDSITKQLNLLRKQRSQETGLQLRDVSRDSLRKKTQRAEKVYKFIEQVGLDKIKYIKSYSATSISELTNEQIQEVIDCGISSEQLSLLRQRSIDYDDVYFDEELDYDSTPQSVKETNEEVVSQSVKTDDDSNCNRNSDSEEEMPDDSDDDGYNGYGGYNEYDECDRGYYYRDGRYERRGSPMMSSIISPVTAC
ncbi:hypothetical protein RhiirA5_499651 [Rhizophagus irregularis]|uniref:Uncharacterized protein n=1 Tax=Rhizophagus irregularis TaxID=588596 RepID=A0A2N0PQ13_9GLOM|nr:hypothetical protein RhiirA5_499651 [Rhizophagus irregularis]